MYPYDTIFSIYKRIGKITPFQVKRSHKGRGVTDIHYRYSQEGYTFMVEKVVLNGIESEAYGYCMVNGIRNDSCVKKYYPENNGEIPNARANSWVLIDVPGIDMSTIFPVHTANEVIKSGKHKGKTYAEVNIIDPNYIEWLRNSNPHFRIELSTSCDIQFSNESVSHELLDLYAKSLPLVKVEDKIPFGRYKGKTFRDVYLTNPQYIKWLFNNCNTINFDIVAFKEMMSIE